MQLRTSVYNGFFAVHAIYTTTTAKPFTGLYSGVSANLPCFVAVVWRVHPAMLHRLRHVGAHTVKRSTSNDTKHHRHTGRCTGQGNRPIIIRYIRVQVCAHARRYSISQTMPARRGQRLHLYRVSLAASRCFSRPAVCGLALGQRSYRTRPAWNLPPGGTVQ